VQPLPDPIEDLRDGNYLGAREEFGARQDLTSGRQRIGARPKVVFIPQFVNGSAGIPIFAVAPKSGRMWLLTKVAIAVNIASEYKFNLYVKRSGWPGGVLPATPGTAREIIGHGKTANDGHALLLVGVNGTFPNGASDQGQKAVFMNTAEVWEGDTLHLDKESAGSNPIDIWVRYYDLPAARPVVNVSGRDEWEDAPI